MAVRHDKKCRIVAANSAGQKEGTQPKRTDRSRVYRVKLAIVTEKEENWTQQKQQTTNNKQLVWSTTPKRVPSHEAGSVTNCSCRWCEIINHGIKRPHVVYHTKHTVHARHARMQRLPLLLGVELGRWKDLEGLFPDLSWQSSKGLTSPTATETTQPTRGYALHELETCATSPTDS